jgi:hypothetical protein
MYNNVVRTSVKKHYTPLRLRVYRFYMVFTGYSADLRYLTIAMPDPPLPGLNPLPVYPVPPPPPPVFMTP